MLDCRISNCPRRGRVFSSTKLLAAHLRKVHKSPPEIDELYETEDTQRCRVCMHVFLKSGLRVHEALAHRARTGGSQPPVRARPIRARVASSVPAPVGHTPDTPQPDDQGDRVEHQPALTGNPVEDAPQVDVPRGGSGGPEQMQSCVAHATRSTPPLSQSISQAHSSCCRENAIGDGASL